MSLLLGTELQAKFTELIAARTGLHVPPRDTGKLRQIIAGRMKCLRVAEPCEYFGLLAGTGPANQKEWEQFTGPLTTGESYFLRDKGQFALLKNQILPELIDRNRRQRTLRLWSAGCSSGEEPYSLAMVVTELLPQWPDWKILILGTDINQTAIEKARNGVYSAWSFRGVDPAIKSRYFHARRDEWEIAVAIRSLVKFRTGNLLEEAFPGAASEIAELDLIICRNVFIYFGRDAVSVILRKFSRSLNVGGYLLTGHTEVFGVHPGEFQARVFPESLIYQRGNACPIQPKAKSPRLAESPRPPKPAQPRVERNGHSTPVTEGPASGIRSFGKQLSPIDEAALLIDRGHCRAALEKLERLLLGEPRNGKALTLAAQAHANLGEYPEATDRCQQALAVDPMAVAPHYLLAHIAEHRGEPETAKSHFKKLIYLDPAFSAAYLELAALYDREDHGDRASKMRSTALELIRKVPAESVVEAYAPMTAGELASYVEKMLVTTKP